MLSLEQIAQIVLEILTDRQLHNVEEVVQKTAKQTSAYRANVKLAILILIRRQKVLLTDDFKVTLP